MGNTTPSSQITSQIINKHWQPITPTLWKNKATCQIIKEKRLIFQSEQQMRYVFGCLVRRMNNYHPNVFKVFYLRKHYEKGSVCNCGEKHTIQVYLQNVESTLQKYLISHPKNQQQPNHKYILPNRKCLCMQIVKAALYLKERYGPFLINKTNVWIQQPHVQHQYQDRRLPSLSSSIQKLHQQNYSQQKLLSSFNNIKAKLWISAEQQQNYPDNSCQEKEMCKSIVELIRDVLIRNRLCGCYPNMEVLERYHYLNTLKDLQENMRRQHEVLQTCHLITSSVVQGQPKMPFTRVVRSFSSQDSSSQPQTFFAPNLSQLQNRGIQFVQQPSQRKYSSIQYVRKPIQKQHLNMTVGKNTQIIKNPPSYAHEQIIINAPRINSVGNQKPNISDKIGSFVPDGAIPSFRPENIKERPKANTIYEKPKQKHNLMNSQNSRTAQIINSKSQYRHGNHFINRQIINIADMTGNINFNMQGNSSLNVIKTQRQQQIKKVTQQNNQIPQQNNVQTPRYRSSSNIQNGTVEVSNIDFNNEANKIKCISISLDKGTDPTDRTKFDLSLKEDQKKQQQAINTSRKNISIIPISMQSTSGAGSILKPIIHSHDQFHKVQAQNRDFQQQIIQKNQQSVQESKQKKQSASSTKSQKNYTSYQVTNSKKFQNQQIKSIVKKRMSDSIMPSKKSSDGNLSKQNFNLKESVKKQKQRSQSTLNRLQDTQVIGSQEMGRLRKSQYVISQQNSLVQSKKKSRKQSKDIVENTDVEKKNELTSLALMQFKFKTNVSIGQKNENFSNFKEPKKIQIIAKPQVSIRECTSGELGQYNLKEINRVQQNMQQRHNEMSSDRLEKLKETPQSSRRQSLKDHINQSQKSSSVQQSLRSIQFQPQTFSRIDSPYNEPQKSNTPQMSQLIKQEIEQPSISLNHFQAQQQVQQQYQYHININSQQTYFYQDSLESLERQKQMSHPLLTQPNMMKKLSLKEEFNQLLNFDDDEYDQSLRAKAQTQDKQKRLKLDQKQGKQTVSIYNESQYNQSDNVSKRASQKDFDIKFSNPPLNKKKQTNTVSKYARQNKVKKPISKHQLDKEMIKKKMEQIMLNDNEFKQANPQQILRLTSSGHEDNSIKQKVISKKAQFAQLKNQMNNLLL